MSQIKLSNERIAKIIEQGRESGLNFKQTADHFGIPVWKIYEHNKSAKKNNNSHKQPTKIFEQVNPESESHSTDGLSTQGLEPTKQPQSDLPNQVKSLITEYRKQHPSHGFKRIEQHLQKTYFLVVPRKQIRQVLKSAGLLDNNDSSFDNKSKTEPKAIRNFEASAPRDLYQMDITYIYIEGIKVLYLVDIIDDHSRFCLSSSLQFDQSSDTLIEVLHKAIEMYGKPKKMLTDQGRAFYSWSMEHTKFQRYLDDMQIEHILTDPHHPTTTGKVERFHQTIKNELIRKVKFKDYLDAVNKIESFVHYYNYERPHQSLDGACPADRFMGVSISKSLARHELLSKGLETGKGYLVYKVGAHEINIIHTPEHGPKVIVNGVCYVPENPLVV